MNWHKHDIKDSTTHPDKDKYLIVKMITGEHWTGCYCGNGYWIIYRRRKQCTIKITHHQADLKQSQSFASCCMCLPVMLNDGLA